MSEADLVRAIEKHPMLALLPPASLQTIAQTSKTVSYRANRMVIREGDEPRAFCLLSGAARVFHKDGGKEVTVKLFCAPALGGEMEVLCKRNFLVNMRTLDTSEVLFIVPELFEQLVQKHLAFAAALCTDLSARLFIATSNERALAFSDVETRMADLLLDYAHVCGVQEDTGIRLNLPLTQGSMARDLAVSRKSLVRGLATFKKQGLLDKVNGRYLIKNAKALTERSSGGLALYYRLNDALTLRRG